MDTRYWGPSGWRLLHLISFAATPSRYSHIRALFETLPYVLPCKYCRESLSEYIAADPLPANASALPKWLWRIHNDVNAKLRGQHLHVEPDPPFQTVKRIYSERLDAGCSRTHFEGWEFLFSIAEAHPLSRQTKTSVPIKDHPPKEGLTDLELNQWNLMTPEERMPYYTRFWNLLPHTLPFPEWSAAWRQAVRAAGPPVCRAECLKYLWTIRRHLEKELELLNSTTYDSLCKELRNHRSKCSASTRGKTCRRKRV